VYKRSTGSVSQLQFGDAPRVFLALRSPYAMEAASAALTCSSPLNDAGILKEVLSYVRTGEFIFYAPISKLWLECYRAVPAHELVGKNTACRKQNLKVLSMMTLRRAVYVSVARLKVAYAAGLRFDDDSLKMQVYTGSIASRAVLAEAHKLGLQLSSYTLSGAAGAGELFTVIWLYYEHNCALNSQVDAYSAGGGRIEVLKWLKQQGIVFDEVTVYSAAMAGQHFTCGYLLSEGCRWDESAVYAAALNSHWDTVRWLHAQGCPWDFVQIGTEAARQGSIEGMAYVLQQEPVSDYDLSYMLQVAGANDHLAAAQWLREERVAEWPLVLRCGGRFWLGDVLEWARAEGCDSPLW
jgi:hypothetical protein